MKDTLSDQTRAAIAEAAAGHSGLDLLVLHGSRADGSFRSSSDWDFGFVAKAPVELDLLIADLVRLVGSDRIDVADLERASGLLRYRAARDGIPLYERDPGAFSRFWLEAVRFWCDAAPLLGRGYDDILDRLDR